MADSNNKRKERSEGGGKGGGRDARDGNGDNRGGKRAKVCEFLFEVLGDQFWWW